MTRVLHLVLNLKVGGLERFVIELSNNYSKNVVPYIVCLEEKGELGNLVKGVEIIALKEKPGIKLRSVFRIMSIIKTNNIQLIHTHNEAAHFYGSLAGYFSKIPVIHTRHGRYLHKSKKRILLNRISSYLSAKIVGVSRDAADLIIDNETTATDKVLTILNGVDVNVYALLSTRDDEISNDENLVKIGIVARLDIVKDHSNLLKACSILSQYGCNYLLFIVGDGALRDKLEKQADELLIKDKVVFTGTRHDIADILKELDIYVLSSVSEGISMTLLEAMACCLPVVATDVGGNPEVVIDGKTGFLVPPKNPELLAEKMLTLIQDKSLRINMGKLGRETVIQKFSISQTALQYEKLYDEVLEISV